ncbi:MAG: lipid-A-disaccharide synthase-related protein [Candidatus Eremiobacteraeota bacterium]|nr:lipid-A-disaccharide synthase-related protein [Candidatus Eremiobacteraeota bacterium]
MTADILLVSNGYGEAAIAGYIARAIRELDPGAQLAHLPLVGSAPPDAWPPGVGPQRSMPSGGLVTNWNVRHLVKDLAAGLGRLTWQQSRYLSTQRTRDAVVAVGDVYCLALSSFFARRPSIFVATAKSDYVARHSALECAIARRASATFARDEPTARSLRNAGVAARYAGNVMMDGLHPISGIVTRSLGALHVAVLPGSRNEAARNAQVSARHLASLATLLAQHGRRVQAFFAPAPSVADADIAAAITDAGFPLTVSPDVHPAVATHGNLTIAIVRGAFADVLHAADIVFGQAGTANEQAAGLGRPVFAAAEPGERPDKMHWYRMRQKRLLGDALMVLPADPDAFARGVAAVLDDPAQLARMSATGKQRLGLQGGARAVAAAALELAAETKRSAGRSA